MCSFGDGAEEWSEAIAISDADLRCEECELPIPSGTRHTLVEMLYEGEDSTHRFHRECARLARDAAAVVCGEPYWQIGELPEHLDILEDPEASEDHANEYGLDPYDRDDVRRILRAWDAIEAKYGGGEFDLGGEA